MCFSEQWSRNLSILGIGLTTYRYMNNYSWIAMVPSCFYTIMEVTQYLQYKVIDDCENIINQYLTLFSWITRSNQCKSGAQERTELSRHCWRGILIALYLFNNIYL